MEKNNLTIKEWHAKTLKKGKYLYEGDKLDSAKRVFDSFILDRLPKVEIIEKWHQLLTKYLSDDNSNVFFVRKYESTKNNGEWDNRRGAVVSFDRNNVEIVYSSNNLAHEIYLMARDEFVPDYDDFVDTINTRALPITSGTEIEKKIRLYKGGSNKRCEGYLAHLFDVNGDYYIDGKTFSVDNRRLYPKGIENDWLNSPDKIYHIKDSLSSGEISIIKAHMLRFLDPINYFVMPKNNEQKVNGNAVKVNYGEDDKFLQYVKYTFNTKFKNTFDDFCNTALTNYSAELVDDYKVDFSYCNEDICHKTVINELKHVSGIDSAVIKAYKFTYDLMKKCDFECPNCDKCKYLEACFNSLLHEQNHPQTVSFEELYKCEQEYISTVVLV